MYDHSSWYSSDDNELIPLGLFVNKKQVHEGFWILYIFEKEKQTWLVIYKHGCGLIFEKILPI